MKEMNQNMSKQLALACLFIILISFNVSATNYCKTGTPDYDVYYPDGFTADDIPDTECWCNADYDDPPDIFTVDYVAILVKPPFILNVTESFDYTYPMPIDTAIVVKFLDEHIAINSIPDQFSPFGGGPSIERPEVRNYRPPVEVVVSKISNGQPTEVKIANNNYECNEGTSCYDTSKELCTGKPEIMNLYTFNELGEYDVSVYLYQANNADPTSKVLAANFRVNIIPNYDPDEHLPYLTPPEPPSDEEPPAEPPSDEEPPAELPIIPERLLDAPKEVLTISSPNPYRIIEITEKTKISSDTPLEIPIIWTLINAGGDVETGALIVQSVSLLGCNDGTTPEEVGTCELLDQNPFPMRINGKTNSKLFEQIKITDIPASSLTESFGLSVTYTDIDGQNERTVTTSADAVSLSYVFSEKRKFQIELLGGKPRYCLASDGQIGGTGKGMTPRVKFDWYWNSWAGILQEDDPVDASPIGNMFACDKEANDNIFYFCDPTQFTITIVEKLNYLTKVIDNYNEKVIEGYDGQGEEAITYLTHFQAYLIGDNYNADFKSDFVEFYKGSAFFDPPPYFTNTRNGWWQYLEDDTRLKFINSEDGTSQIESGLYDVVIEVDFGDNYSSDFFEDDEPAATINITLTKSSDYDAPSNPLYFMPFNGNVGLESGREGYGMSYNNIGSQSINLTKIGQNDYFELESGLGNDSSYIFTTDIQNTFTEVNQTNRGALLTINLSETPGSTGKKSGTIIFSPSKATPVFAGALSEGSEAAFYYYITKGGAMLNITPTTYWSGISANYSCANFDGTTLPLNRADLPATIAEVSVHKCTSHVILEQSQKSSGFKWSDFTAFEPDSKVAIFSTIFYVPDEGGEYKLFNACRNYDSDMTTSIFLAPSHSEDGVPSSGVWIGNADSGGLLLNYSSLDNANPNSTKTIQQIFDLMDDERTCLTVEHTADKFEMKIWWNEAKLIDETVRWWKDELGSDSGNFAELTKLIKEEQLQTCGRP